MVLSAALTKHLSSSGKAKWVADKKRQRKKRAVKKRGLNKIEKSQVKKIIANKKEFKFCPSWFNYDDYGAYAGFIQRRIVGTALAPNIYDVSNAPVTLVGLQTGNYLNTASTAVNTMAAPYGTAMYPLGGLGMLRGDSNTTIDGDFAYMQSSRVMLEISVDPAEANADIVNDTVTPLEFRLIQVRAKRDQAGVTPSLTNELFVDLTNDKEGLNMAGSVKEIMNDFPVNSARFTKVKDFRFKLTQPVQPGYAGVTNSNSSPLPPYPNRKQLTLWCHKPSKKIRFSKTDDGAFNYYEPVNYDFVEYIIILCSRCTYNDRDMSNTQESWTVAVQGQTKYRDC